MATLPNSRPLRREVHLRDCDHSDFAQVAALMARNGVDPISAEDWKRFWVANPALRIDTRWTPGWVLENEAGDVVGYVGSIPLSYVLNGRALAVATGRNWVADPAYRSSALLLMDRFFRQSHVDLFLNSAAKPEARQVFPLLNNAIVPTRTYEESLFWITNHTGFAATALRLKSSRATTLPIASILAGVLVVQDTLRSRRAPHTTKSIAQMYLDWSDGFGERFDDFWEEMRATETAKLLPIRTTEMLSWTFQVPSRTKGLWIATLSAPGGRLRAYAVFVRQDKPRVGLVRMRLADFQSNCGDGVLVTLVSMALQRCRLERIHMLEIVGASHSSRRALFALAPRTRVLPPWLFFYKSHNNEVAAQLQIPEAWERSLLSIAWDCTFL